MKIFERPMMALGVLFSVVMAILGWWVALHVGSAENQSSSGGVMPDPAAVVIACLGTLALICALIGWAKRAMMLTAGGVLGCGLLFPTGFGFVPMIIGGALALLMIGLKVYETMEGEA